MIEFGKGTPRSAATVPMDDAEKRLFAALRKLNLRHPGMISPKIAKLLKADTLSGDQMNAAMMEWRRLHPNGEML